MLTLSIKFICNLKKILLFSYLYHQIKDWYPTIKLPCCYRTPQQFFSQIIQMIQGVKKMGSLERPTHLVILNQVNDTLPFDSLVRAYQQTAQQLLVQHVLTKSGLR